MNINKMLLIKNKQVLNEYLETKTEEDIVKENELASKVLAFYQEMYNPKAEELSYTMFGYDFCGFGHNSKNGYYVVDYDSSTSYKLLSFGDSLDSAFLYLANNILDKERTKFEEKNNTMIKRTLHESYASVPFYDRLFKCVYDLNKWERYFKGNIPKEIINLYLKYVNNTYGLYEANAEFTYKNHRLVYKENVRSLKK